MISRSATSLAVKAATAAVAIVGLVGLGGAPAFAAQSESPAIVVTPSTDLIDGQQVSVSVTGFAPNESVYLTECTMRDETDVVCDADAPPPVTTDETGAVATSFTVRATFPVLDDAGNQIGVTDCVTAPSGCFVAVSDASAQRFAFAPISFLPPTR